MAEFPSGPPVARPSAEPRSRAGEADGLAVLEQRVRHDLAALNLPPANWPASTWGEDGSEVLDVLVVGAGMLGIAAASALICKGIRNVQMIDRASRGREGPWTTYARMETLRSPKHLTGPALGIPSLTFRAWYEAREGSAGWDALYKIPNAAWAEYLGWLSEVLALPVTSETELTGVEPSGSLLQVSLRGPAGPHRRLVRHLVLATGRGGTGGGFIPDFVDPALFPDLAAHTVDPIDFGALRGRRVAVLGGGASAWDNAATALEAGAASAEMYVRRTVLPQVNKSRGTANPGWYYGWEALTDAEKWAFSVYLEDLQAPPPHETVHRTIRHPQFRLHLGAPITAAAREGGEVRLRVGGRDAEERADFLIVGTGFKVDLSAAPELRAVAAEAATWGDRYRPPEALVRPALARYPYLGPAFELTERVSGACPALSRIHLFNYSAHLSHRQLSGDIPGVDVGAEKLAVGVAQALFREDLDHLRAELEAFAEPELESTPFFALPQAPRAG
ncbi:NAD(P)-binding domain-containing protein [Enterovirga aerilata]|uniref:NAD(P)/FAD-dependent oxidoreductase n=1 Tax=Enterovirga aerilata TaxID=2730920 RepID=A0A849IDH5_9HYPH|nr:NAD(P)/FAD-dependent oxidoreductase [Enterovirga sp. DB1703]NNM74090.1 NAD(P)/FAD-dependent oxidoreductase [Enterovirga sp. DB1703]